MEVNTCPSLAADTSLDKSIKTAMVSDAMHLLGPVPYDRELYDANEQAVKEARLTGLPVQTPSTTGSDSKPQRSASSPGARKLSGISKAEKSGMSSSRASGAASKVPATIIHRTVSSTGRPSNKDDSSILARKQPAWDVMPTPRTVQEAERTDFRGIPPHLLPEVVIEAEAEDARRRGWQRVFPCTQQPMKYLELFETPRALSIMLCRYYACKLGADPDAVSCTAGKGPRSDTHAKHRPKTGTKGADRVAPTGQPEAKQGLSNPSTRRCGSVVEGIWRPGS